MIPDATEPKKVNFLDLKKKAESWYQILFDIKNQL